MNPERGRILVEAARAAIAEAFGGPAPRPPAGDWLREPAAVFVSLHRDGQLRGCMGALEPGLSLFEEVVDKAKAAAFRDHRMVPVQAQEVADLDIEITVLDPLESMEVRNEADLVSSLRSGVDGLVLRSQEGSAVFIPAVWRQLPDPRDFLRNLMRKAGLRGWPPDLRAFRFSAEECSSREVGV